MGGGVGADGVEDVAGAPTGGCVTVGAATVGVGVDVVRAGVETVGVETVDVGSGRVTDVRVGSVGGSRASAGPTSVAVVATATAKHTIDRAFGIRLYNPHRAPRVTLRGQRKSANCNFFANSHDAD